MPLFCTMVFFIGSEEEQTQYCFQIYDINSDGFITREEMTTLMKNCLMRYREENKHGLCAVCRQGFSEDDGDSDEGIKVRDS